MDRQSSSSSSSHHYPQHSLFSHPFPPISHNTSSASAPRPYFPLGGPIDRSESLGSNTSGSLDQGLTIKAHFVAYDEIRRFKLEPVSWSALVLRISQIFGIPQSGLDIRYEDEEGDRVTISSHEEFMEVASNYLKDEGGTGILHLFICSVPNNTFASPSGSGMLIDNQDGSEGDGGEKSLLEPPPGLLDMSSRSSVLRTFTGSMLLERPHTLMKLNKKHLKKLRKREAKQLLRAHKKAWKEEKKKWREAKKQRVRNVRNASGVLSGLDLDPSHIQQLQLGQPQHSVPQQQLQHPTMPVQALPPSMAQASMQQAPLQLPQQHQNHQPQPSGLKARFVKHVTIPDGTQLAPSTVFTKIWRFRNEGTLDWPADTCLIFISVKNGDQMGAPSKVPLGNVVRAGEMVDVSVTLMSPTEPGMYCGFWRLCEWSTNRKFGQRVWVKIHVVMEDEEEETSRTPTAGVSRSRSEDNISREVTMTDANAVNGAEIHRAPTPTSPSRSSINANGLKTATQNPDTSNHSISRK